MNMYEKFEALERNGFEYRHPAKLGYDYVFEKGNEAFHAQDLENLINLLYCIKIENE